MHNYPVIDMENIIQRRNEEVKNAKLELNNLINEIKEHKMILIDYFISLYDFFNENRNIIPNSSRTIKEHIWKWDGFLRLSKDIHFDKSTEAHWFSIHYKKKKVAHISSDKTKIELDLQTDDWIQEIYELYHHYSTVVFKKIEKERALLNQLDITF